VVELVLARRAIVPDESRSTAFPTLCSCTHGDEDEVTLLNVDSRTGEQPTDDRRIT